MQFVGKSISHEITAPDRPLERRNARQLPALTPRMRVQHPDPAIEIETRDLDGPTGDLLRPDGERPTPGLNEFSEADLALSSCKKRAEMRVMRLWQAWIDPPVEQRCVEMHALDSKEPRRKHGGCHAHKIDPVTGELPARSMHEVETVDEHAGAEPRHCKPSFPET
jgi:hypothetical protein